jgi:hypothetical protein
MIGTMALGGNVFADELNAFNRVMITQCDFSTMAGVRQYIESDGVTRCRAIAQKVALRSVHVLLAHHARSPVYDLGDC